MRENPNSGGWLAAYDFRVSLKTNLLVGTLLFVAGYAAFHEEIADALKSDASRVQVSASLDPSKCEPTRPLQLSVQNDSSKPIKSIRFGLSVHERGDSTNVMLDAPPEWTRVVEPHRAMTACAPIRVSPPRGGGGPLVAVINWKLVTFYEPGETVPR